jgi:uncharacterized protein (DUF1501 family)
VCTIISFAPVVGAAGAQVVRRPETVADQLTAARELCDAGEPFVLVPVPGWDLHADVADGVNRLGPPVDAAAADFLDRLEADGRAGEVLLVLTGEFGRTPWLNRHGGRDHWPAETPLLMGGATAAGVWDDPLTVADLHRMMGVA